MLLTGACAGKQAAAPAPSAGQPAPLRPDDAAGRSCAAQAEEVEDALVRLADRYLWEELEKLLGLWMVARGSGAAACSEATEAALLTAARRWAEEGARTGGSQISDLAQRAYRALARHFPGAEADLDHAFGRLEWTRAVRIASDLGEQTLAAERYAAAQRHHAAALRRGGLTPEQARISAVEQLEAMRRALDYQATGWAAEPWLCKPDRTGTCQTRPRSPVPLELAPADAQMLAAFDLYLAVFAADPGPQKLAEAPVVAVDRAELLLRHGRLAEAEAGLREVLRAHDGEPIGARAGLLLLRSLQVRWQDPAASPAAKAQARGGLIATTAELRKLRVWQLATAASEQLRRDAPDLRAAAMWQAAVAARQARDFAECAQLFADMSQETGTQGHDEAALRFESAVCHEEGGAFSAAIAGYGEWLARFSGDRRAPEVELRLARTNERVQNVEEARDHYIRFLALAPGDPRTTEVQRRSIALALVTGTVDEAQVEALTRDRRSGDHLLAAAIRFRTEVRAGSTAARITGYIQRFGRDGGEGRLAIAHVRAAEVLMRSSCPVGAVDGLCVEVTRDKTLGRVLARDKTQLAQVRAHLDAATRLLAIDSTRADGLGAPLEVAPGELAAARRVLSLLLGDLGAEAALSTRPPASYEPTRSREWFRRRIDEVQRMQVVYEGVDPRGVALGIADVEALARDRFAAVIEARKAQVYEADIGLLEEVAGAVAARSPAGSEGAELATTMQRLADARRGEVFQSYHRCIELVALWGEDPDGRAESCRAGLGRLVQRYEARLEYAPDLRGEIH